MSWPFVPAQRLVEAKRHIGALEAMLMERTLERDAERAALRSLMEQVTQAALAQPAVPAMPEEAPLPSFPKIVELAITERAPKQAKLHRNALRDWARKQLRGGAKPHNVAAAIADGEADSELEVTREEVG